MRRPLRRPALWAALCCAALFASVPASADAAPAPFRKTARPDGLRPGTVAGNWVLYWHGSRGSVTLACDGSYTCKWCGLQFVGTWRLGEGRLWITETYRPSDKRSWHTFSVALSDAGAGQPSPIRLERSR